MPTIWIRKPRFCEHVHDCDSIVSSCKSCTTFGQESVDHAIVRVTGASRPDSRTVTDAVITSALISKHRNSDPRRPAPAGAFAVVSLEHQSEAQRWF